MFIDRVESIHLKVSYTCIHIRRTIARLSPRIPIVHHLAVLSSEFICTILFAAIFFRKERKKEETRKIFIPIWLTKNDVPVDGFCVQLISDSMA